MTLETSSTSSLPTIGILGDGQLSMMMAQAYRKLGGKTFIYGASDSGPGSIAADKVFVGGSDDIESLSAFFNAVDIVTLENEFYDSKLLSHVSERCETAIYPDPKRFGLIEDKLSEKQFFQSLGVSLADFLEIKDAQDIPETAGYLKLAKGGYDGIGTYSVADKKAATKVFETIKSAGTVLFEKKVNFKKELSLLAVSDGNELVFYPIVETYQEDGTCRYVSYPAGVSSDIETEAQSQVGRIMKKLDTRGIFAFELFLTEDDQLILNESAPRPHNSGHITMDSMDCSQFENHMRAVSGLPLKQPTPQKESMLMVNLLGTQTGKFDAEAVTEQLTGSESSVTLYQKRENRVKRKMGHFNIWGDDQKPRAEKLLSLLDI